MESFVKRLEILKEMQGEIAKHLRCHTCGAVAFTKLTEGKELCQKCHWQHEYDKRNVSTNYYICVDGLNTQEMGNCLKEALSFIEPGMHKIKEFKIKGIVEGNIVGQTHTLATVQLVTTEKVEIRKGTLTALFGSRLKTFSRFVTSTKSLEDYKFRYGIAQL